jgi:hypothetical protein
VSIHGLTGLTDPCSRPGGFHSPITFDCCRRVLTSTVVSRKYLVSNLPLDFKQSSILPISSRPWGDAPVNGFPILTFSNRQCSRTGFPFRSVGWPHRNFPQPVAFRAQSHHAIRQLTLWPKNSPSELTGWKFSFPSGVLRSNGCSTALKLISSDCSSWTISSDHSNRRARQSTL